MSTNCVLSLAWEIAPGKLFEKSRVSGIVGHAEGDIEFFVWYIDINNDTWKY